jgi:hypothetical protein
MPPPERTGVDAAEIAAAVEEAGFTSLRVGGGNPDPDAFARLRAQLAGSGQLIVATGITNIWAWQPGGLRAAAEDLAADFPGRFILGLGVSHAPAVEARPCLRASAASADHAEASAARRRGQHGKAARQETLAASYQAMRDAYRARETDRHRDTRPAGNRARKGPAAPPGRGRRRRAPPSPPAPALALAPRRRTSTRPRARS